MESFLVTSNTSATVSWSALDDIHHNDEADSISYVVVYTSEGDPNQISNITDTFIEITGEILWMLGLELGNIVTTVCVLFIGLVPNTNYTVQVAAMNSAGKGPYSDVVANTTFEGSMLWRLV